jgi:pimeloyl-ACP methyl ester carboxylesterase
MATQVIPSRDVGTHIAVDGLETFFIKAGSGHPLVLIHGGAPGACTLVNYGPVIQPLADCGFTVYAYDQPGFGLTEQPKDHSQEFRVAHAKGFIEAVGLDRYHVVGNSMGVYISVRLASEDPKAARLVLIAGGGMTEDISPEAQETSRKHGQDLGAYTPSVENARALLRGTLYKQDLVTDELVQLRYEMSTGPNFEAQQARSKAQAARPIVDDLRRLTNPTLVMWGRNDRGSVIERAYRAFEAIPGAELHTFNECAHWPMWDQTARFTSVVSDFLSS